MIEHNILKRSAYEQLLKAVEYYLEDLRRTSVPETTIEEWEQLRDAVKAQIQVFKIWGL